MRHSTIRGKILYLRDGLETGRDWFTVTKHVHGARTFRALCEMDDHELLRDVTYSVGPRWEPLDCFIRLSVHDRLMGTCWFHFDDQGGECEGFTRAQGQ